MNAFDDSHLIYIGEMRKLVERVHQGAKTNGFWDTPDGDNAELTDLLMLGTKVARVHGELSELLESIRQGDNQPSSKIDGFSKSEEECADVIIMLFDIAGQLGLDVGGAMMAKINFNETREYKHGRLF